MTLEFVREKNVYCPQCGKSRGVTLWVERDIPAKFGSMKYTKDDYFIRCKHCRIRYQIINFGVDSCE